MENAGGEIPGGFGRDSVGGSSSWADPSGMPWTVQSSQAAPQLTSSLTKKPSRSRPGGRWWGSPAILKPSYAGACRRRSPSGQPTVARRRRVGTRAAGDGWSFYRQCAAGGQGAKPPTLTPLFSVPFPDAPRCTSPSSSLYQRT